MRKEADQESWSDTAYEDPDGRYEAFVQGQGATLIRLASGRTTDGTTHVQSEGLKFRKWVRHHHKDVTIDTEPHESKLVLKSQELVFPLVFLGSDVTVQFFLGLVVNYVYDLIKGALSGDKNRVKLEVVYTDAGSGKRKQFSFDGPVGTLEKVIKKIDVNKLVE